MKVRVVVCRCPKCGSTDAGEVSGVADYANMECGHCGHTAFVDDYEIKSDWNLAIEVEEGTAIPAFVAPLPPD